MAVVHGHRRTNRLRTPTYNSWRAMIERCTRPAHPFYADYGGRGITVCEQWTGHGGFVNFLADVGERPLGKTLDRKNVEGNYEPGNVRWVTKHEQRWNRRDMAERAYLTGLEPPDAPAAPAPAEAKEEMPF